MALKSRKGMEMPLVLVVGAVVLIVISLIVISITSGGLTKFFKTTSDVQGSAGSDIQCESWKSQACLDNNIDTTEAAARDAIKKADNSPACSNRYTAC